MDGLSSARDKEGKALQLDSVAVSTRHRALAHLFASQDEPHDLRSVSKPILCLALGLGLEQGLKVGGVALELETPVWQFFEPHVRLDNKRNLSALKQLRLSHLLNSTLGTNEGLMFRKDIGDRDETTFLDYIFNYEFAHKPGDFFVYSNAGAYLVSVLMQFATGNLAEVYVRKAVFDRLGIQNYSWRKFGDYTAGCTGLMLNNGDLQKIGRLIADQGVFAGKQIIPKKWVNLMKSVRVPTPSMYDAKRALPKFAYGHYLWKTKEGHSYTDGTDGQYLIILADSDTVITTLGRQPDMKPITEQFRVLLG